MNKLKNKFITWTVAFLILLLSLVLFGRGDVAWFIVTLPFTIVSSVLYLISAIFVLLLLCIVIYAFIYNLNNQKKEK